MNEKFRRFAEKMADAAGSSWAFLGSVVIIVVWIVTGPIFGFSDTWQLVINSVTNVLTLLMVFLIQNTQNRDTRATQLKLDELLRSVEGARTGFVDLERLPDDELQRLSDAFTELQKKHAHEIQPDAILDSIADEDEIHQTEAAPAPEGEENKT